MFQVGLLGLDQGSEFPRPKGGEEEIKMREGGEGISFLFFITKKVVVRGNGGGIIGPFSRNFQKRLRSFRTAG